MLAHTAGCLRMAMMRTGLRAFLSTKSRSYFLRFSSSNYTCTFHDSSCFMDVSSTRCLSCTAATDNGTTNTESQMSLIPGRADAAGTAGYAEKFASTVGKGHFRTLSLGGESGNITVSSLGLGTYLGPETEKANEEYGDSISKALSVGINVLDTAINYRGTRSELAVGHAVANAISSGLTMRNQVMVCTKGGYLTLGIDPPSDPRQWVEDTFVEPGIFSWSDFVGGCHCMASGYIKHQLDNSRKNLGLETVDVYYLHNPETQLQEVSRTVFYKRIQAAFMALEEAYADGKIRAYGTATWNGFRVPPKARDHLSLEELVHAAQAAGGEGHHFKVIQLPFNLAMQEAARSSTQVVKGREMPLLDAAKELGVAVVTSASLLQAKLCKTLPRDVAKVFADGGSGKKLTNAQCALQYARITRNITTALVGMRNVAHVEENSRVISLSATPW